MKASLTFLGTGTSNGIPVIGCSCPVCTSSDPQNNRTRASVFLESPKAKILIDTGPDFRTQALKRGIQHLDGIFMTHHHADHLHGIDDVRPLSYHAPVELFASEFVIEEIKSRFNYMFAPPIKGTSVPQLNLKTLDGELVRVKDLPLLPIPISHGDLTIFGYRFFDCAYLTDCSAIPSESWSLLKGVKTLIVGALRHRPHPTHFTVADALEVGKKLQVETLFLTHLSHEIDHGELQSSLPPWANVAYDGLQIFFGGNNG